MIKVLEKSIILPAFFPTSMDNAEQLLTALKLIKNYDISFIEFYYRGSSKEEIKKYISEFGFKTIYLGAMAAKTQGLNLCSLNGEERKKSVNKIKDCIKDAYYYNSRTILLNSGRRPEEAKIKDAYQYLKESLKELIDFADSKASSYMLNFVIESGDEDVDSCELIGNTQLALELVKDMREYYSNFGLTLDTSHLRQLGEEPLKSIKKAFSFCKHIHLANSLLKDKTSNLYGDKHPEFGIENGEISVEQVKNILEELKELYKGNELVCGLEIICRQENEEAYFKSIANKYSWFFKD